MTLPASALPVETIPAFLGVNHSATGRVWRDRLDPRGAAKALAIAQRYQVPEMLARIIAAAASISAPSMTSSIRPFASCCPIL